MRHPRGHVDVVTRRGSQARLDTVVAEEDELGVAFDHIDTRFGLTVVMVPGSGGWGNNRLPHPDRARSDRLPGDGFTPAHPRGLRRRLGQLAGVNVVQVVIQTAAVSDLRLRREAV